MAKIYCYGDKQNGYQSLVILKITFMHLKGLKLYV